VFYVEELDRFAGIRVHSTTPVSVGQSVTVSGKVETTLQGERYINATTVIAGSGTVLGALGANTRAILDYEMEGLLIATAGTVKGLGPDYFTISDGYLEYGFPVEIRVKAGGPSGVGLGDFVVVRGIASYDFGRVILKVP
jgi:hypothetical protein